MLIYCPADQNPSNQPQAFTIMLQRVCQIRRKAQYLPCSRCFYHLQQIPCCHTIARKLKKKEKKQQQKTLAWDIRVHTPSLSKLRSLISVMSAFPCVDIVALTPAISSRHCKTLQYPFLLSLHITMQPLYHSFLSSFHIFMQTLYHSFLLSVQTL